jgi:putative FmdB family regulatory protein
MPIYEYVCRACKHGFEALVYGSEQPSCPRCAGAELEKQFSAFAAPAGDGGRAELDASAGCGTCGDPRGPGACAMS